MYEWNIYPSDVVFADIVVIIVDVRVHFKKYNQIYKQLNSDVKWWEICVLMSTI